MTKKEEKERLKLLNFQQSRTRWFTTEEFARLKELSMKMYDDNFSKNTPEKLAQWVINNRQPKENIQNITDEQMYNHIVEYVKKLIPSKKEYIFRCDVCGQFISYKDINNGDIHINYIPDTPFTTEEILYVHKSCI